MKMSNKNKHIAFFIGSISRAGGTERITSALANQLVCRNYTVSIISLWDGGRPFFPLDSRINCYTLLKSSHGITFQFPIIIWRLISIIKSKNIDILVNVDVILALFSIPLKLTNSGLKIISWEHFNFNINLGVRRRDWARRLSMRYADMIVTLTAQDKSLYRDYAGYNFPICNIPNFIEDIRYNVGDITKKNILAVGRLTYQKGFDLLLEIWCEVKNRIADNDWKLIIVGDGEDREALIAKAQELGLLDGIEFAGEQKNVTTYYKQSSIYVMTSRFEGLPMVLIEAINHGLPIISYNCLTGPAEIVDNDVNGYLIPVEDKRLFINNLIKLINHEDIRKRMQTAALEKKKEFEPNTIVNKWINLFNTI